MEKKHMELVMAAALLVGFFFLAREGARAAYGSTAQKYLVVVDAGHGGDDPGKIGVHGELEKDINLAVAEFLREELEERQITVVMTREEDADLADEDCPNRKAQDLKRRVALINETQPDCVISIHQNSYPDADINGAQVFYYETSAKGKGLADILQTHLVAALDPENHRKSRGNDTYYLMKKSEPVLAIVECGFLSNPDEAALLADPSYQKKVAAAVADGVEEYLGETAGGSDAESDGARQDVLQAS